MLSIIPPQKVKVKWVGYTKKYYENLGYEFTKMLDEFEVDVEELLPKSNAHVKFVCDYCFGKNQTTENTQYAVLANLWRNRNNDQKDCCKSCINIKYREVHMVKEVPFEETLLYKSPEIEKEWDYELNERMPHEYRYTHNYTDIHWICSSGHRWQDTIYNRSYKNFKCPYCRGRIVIQELSIGELYPHLIKEWHPFKNGDKSSFDVYYRSSKKAWWLCENGHEWETQIRHRSIIETQCPYCGSSETKGEREVRKTLEACEANYIAQPAFENLVGLKGGELRFDFGVLNEKGNIAFLIEYDGEYHYYKIGEDHDFEAAKAHDRIKNQFCIDNKIPLIRIPYWEFDSIDEIVDSSLIHYNIIEERTYHKKWVKNFSVVYTDDLKQRDSTIDKVFAK